MRVSILLHLEAEDYADLATVIHVLHLIGISDLSEKSYHCFGRIISNSFYYDDIEHIRNIVIQEVCDFHEMTLAKALIDQFLRNLWDDIRVNHFSSLLHEKFQGSATVFGASDHAANG